MPQTWVIWVKDGNTLKIVEDETTTPVTTTTVTSWPVTSGYRNYGSEANANSKHAGILAKHPTWVLKSGNPSAPPPQPW